MNFMLTLKYSSSAYSNSVHLILSHNLSKIDEFYADIEVFFLSLF